VAFPAISFRRWWSKFPVFPLVSGNFIVLLRSTAAQGEQAGKHQLQEWIVHQEVDATEARPEHAFVTLCKVKTESDEVDGRSGPVGMKIVEHRLKLGTSASIRTRSANSALDRFLLDLP
jgi:hypothetical protein